MDELIKRFNLPKYLKGKSFAEASKIIDGKFEGMNDKVSNETKMEMLQRLADAQEYMKQQEEMEQAMAMNGMSNMTDPMMMDQNIGISEMIDIGENDFFFGGFMDKLMPGESGGIPGKEMMGGASGVMSKAAPILGAASGAMDMIGSLDGDGLSGDGFSDALSGVSKGASAGMAFGPIGAGIGAVAGGITSLIGSNAAEKKRLNKERQASAKFSNNVYNDYASGGYMNKMGNGGYSKPSKNYYVDGGPITGNTLYDDINPSLARKYAQDFANRNNLSVNFDDPESVMNAQRAMGFTGDAVDGKWGQNTMRGSMAMSPMNVNSAGFDMSSIRRPEATTLGRNNPVARGADLSGASFDLSTDGFNVNAPMGISNEVASTSVQPNTSSTSGSSGGGFNESFLRYAPVATNAFQLMSMDGPEVESLNRLSGRYDPNYVDEMTMQNIVQNQYNDTAGALANASGGNRSALRSNILAANMNKGKALSDAYIKANQINRAEDARGQQFNLGIDQFNIGQSNMEKDINARNRGAYETNKSRLISQIGNDLGDIGLEAYRRRYPEQMGLDYDSRGRRINRKNNKKKRK